MLQHTLSWYNGEIFEGKFILGFGIVLIIASVLFYFLGNTPATRALLIPFLVIALFFSVTGTSMIISNSKKIDGVKTELLQGEHRFIQSEIKRVEGFQYLYPMSIAISLFCFLTALGLLYFVKNIHWQAIAISLILFGTAFAVIDYFSKERAILYYEQLITKQKNE
jgi:hypothetical protein